MILKKKSSSAPKEAKKDNERHRALGVREASLQSGVKKETKLLSVSVVALLPAVAKLVLAVPEDYDDSQQDALIDVVRWEIGPCAFRPDEIEVHDVLSVEVTPVEDEVPDCRVIRNQDGELERDYSDACEQP